MGAGKGWTTGDWTVAACEVKMKRRGNRGKPDITKSNHLEAWCDASVREKGGAYSINFSNIRQMFVFPSRGKTSYEVEEEAVISAMKMILSFRNWHHLEVVKIYTDCREVVSSLEENDLFHHLSKAFKKEDVELKIQYRHRSNNSYCDVALDTYFRGI